MIPKPDGSERPLGIPTIRDRAAQMAVKLVIEPIFEADFCDTSYGFRPKRSAHDAIDDVEHSLNKGYSKVIDADLPKYFDTNPYSKLMTMVAECTCDGALLHLIQMWLKLFFDGFWTALLTQDNLNSHWQRAYCKISHLPIQNHRF